MSDEAEALELLEGLYGAERSIDPLSESEIDRSWKRFATALPPAGAPPDGAPPDGAPPHGAPPGGGASAASNSGLGAPSSSAASSAAYGAAHLFAALGTGLVTGAVVGALTVQQLLDVEPPNVEAIAPVASVSVSEVDAAVPDASWIDAPDAGVASVATISPDDAGPRTSRGGAPTEAVSEGSLAAEQRLIDAARFALARGDAVAALESLRAHRRRYGGGALAEERDGIEIQALLRQGQADLARQRAREFLERYPTSLLRAAVERSLEERP